MPLVTRPEQVIKALERNGFRFVRQRGSHRKYKKDKRTVIVPMCYELAIGTLISISEQSGLTVDELTTK